MRTLLFLLTRLHYPSYQQFGLRSVGIVFIDLMPRETLISSEKKRTNEDAGIRRICILFVQSNVPSSCFARSFGTTSE
jgi:hypothetical protein